MGILWGKEDGSLPAATLAGLGPPPLLSWGGLQIPLPTLPPPQQQCLSRAAECGERPRSPSLQQPWLGHCSCQEAGGREPPLLGPGLPCPTHQPAKGGGEEGGLTAGGSISFLFLPAAADRCQLAGGGQGWGGLLWQSPPWRHMRVPPAPNSEPLFSWLPLTYHALLKA